MDEAWLCCCEASGYIVEGAMNLRLKDLHFKVLLNEILFPPFSLVGLPKKQDYN